MGSIRFRGIRFTAYTMDHEPRHVQAFYADMEVVVNLRCDGTVSLAQRTDAIRPSDGSKSDVRHVLTIAAEHFEELVALWENIMAEHRVITTDAEIETALEAAKLHDKETLAKSVAHTPDLNLLIVTLSNHRRLVLPIEDVQGLEKATHEQIQHYELLGRGTGISFPDLDVDLYVPALIEGVYGNRRWMAHLGKKGGGAKTAAKRLTSQANGAKGGRPKKALA